MAAATHTTRRTLFAIAAGASLATASLPLPAAAHPATSQTWFLEEARELIALTEQVNRECDAALGDIWSARLDAYLDKVEALPLTIENAPIKALAIAVLHHDDPGAWDEERSTDSRLAGQMVKCLTQGVV